MSRPAAKRPADRMPLYADDHQIAAALGISVDEWRANAVVLARSGLPAPDPLFSGRRYWPAVQAFLDAYNGLRRQSLEPIDGGENFDAVR